MNKDSNVELIQAGYRYALALTHHHHDAEDLVQIAWERCHRRYGKVRNRAMLYTTIRNRFSDECRRQKIVSFEGIDVAEEPAAESFSPDGGLDLYALLAHLRAPEREALFLNAVEGYTAAEIAKRTGRPRGTILSLLSRSKAKLAAILNRQKENLRTRTGGRKPEDGQ